MRAPSGNSRRNARQPADAGSPSAPGTRKHSRPCSSAHDAVISAPLRAGASTTTVASASPLMIRLRRGNVPRLGATSGAELGHDRAAGRDDRRRQPAWARGWRIAVAGSDDGHGRAAGADRRRVRGAVDADRQPRDDARADGHEVGGDPCRDAPARVGGAAGPDDGHRRPGAQRSRLAEHVQDVGRHLDGGQPARVGGVLDVTTRRPSASIRRRVAPGALAGHRRWPWPGRSPGCEAGAPRADIASSRVVSASRSIPPGDAASLQDRPTAPVAPEQRPEADRPEAANPGQHGPGVALIGGRRRPEPDAEARPRPRGDSGPATPTPSTSADLGRGQAQVGRPVPGRLVEVRLARRRRRRRDRRSSARPGASAPSHVRSPAPARRGRRHAAPRPGSGGRLRGGAVR